ncbi:FAD-binding oxidoreductase [uncultured Aquitalea sp.]|uniref:FAD-binding oxidoreductase n=1 Tax=uncultured Aquitalea sp. TaxID=540272 RepID=UPI0026011CDD|nr:FAD-binding oxidoreductase [uncultured Aquitalea sp.]
MISSQALAALRRTLAEERVLTDAASLLHYGRDWTRYIEPSPAAIVFPLDVDEVRALVQWARACGVALVPSGGRTGLSAGAVASRGEVVVSFERMNAIRDFDPLSRTVRCQAGVVTGALQTFAEERGLYYPVDFASSGASQIGGNIATNAGGIRVVRYGMTRDWVAGLTVVTGTGEVLELNLGLNKNNSGYDLRHLFIGSEGTLGFVVEAVMKLTSPPPPTRVMVLGVRQLGDIMAVFGHFAGEARLQAFEFFSDQALAQVMAAQGVGAPLDERWPYYVLLEFEAAGDAEEARALAAFAHCVEQGWASDGVMSQSLAQARALWRLREGISEAITPRTPYKNDIAVMISQVPDFVVRLDAILSRDYPDFEVLWYGHIGDGNLHINVLKPQDWALPAFKSACEQVNRQVFELVRAFRGSMSAEHGVGMLKRDYLNVTRSEAEIALMRGVKSVFDPDGVMNPGKLL